MRAGVSEAGWTAGLVLRWDIASTLLLLQIARPSEPDEVRPSVHAYLADRYLRLAEHHRSRGRISKAAHAIERARHHLMLGGPPDLPPAGEMRLGVPRSWRTEVRARGAYRNAA
jgi:hypothetical protein